MECASPRRPGPAYERIGHEALFEEAPAAVCDACGRTMAPSSADRDDDESDGTLPSEGVYLWVRGDEVRREVAPLCGRCAVAIGLAAHARWDVEEEEG